jgi:uncharacterized membrane protein
MIIYALLFVGLIFRLINLNQSLWLDETVQAITSKGTFLNLFTELQGDFHPPLYHLLMWRWAHLFGNGEIAMRLPSVLFGVGTIYLVYLITEQAFPKKPFVPLLSALFLVTAPFHVYYSQEARTYAMTAFFAALSIYCLLRLMNQQKLLVKIAYILSTTLLLYSDYYGLFVFLAQVITILIILRKKITKFLFAWLVIVVLFLPCLPLLWIQLKTGRQATAFLPEWGRLVNLSFLKALPLTFIKFSIGRITIFNKTFYAFVSAFLLIVYGLIFIKGFLKGRKFFIDHCRWVILLWFLIPIVIAWLLSFFIPNYQPFRLLLVLPAFYLLLALGISGISSTKTRIMAITFILLVNLISLGVYYQNPYFHREDWRGTVAYIESQGEEQKALALLPSHTSHWPYTYYSKGKVKLISASQEVKPITEKDIEKLTISLPPLTIYYIYYLADLFDPQNLIPNWLASQKFVKIGEISFNQIRIQEWKQK